MTDPIPPPFADLARRAAYPDDPPAPAVLSLSAIIAGDADPWGLLSYLVNLGRPVATLDDLFAAIGGLEDEDELGAFRCAEGVAVSQASDARWLLFIA